MDFVCFFGDEFTRNADREGPNTDSEPFNGWSCATRIAQGEQRTCCIDITSQEITVNRMSFEVNIDQVIDEIRTVLTVNDDGFGLLHAVRYLFFLRSFHTVCEQTYNLSTNFKLICVWI